MKYALLSVILCILSNSTSRLVFLRLLTFGNKFGIVRNNSPLLRSDFTAIGPSYYRCRHCRKHSAAAMLHKDGSISVHIKSTDGRTATSFTAVKANHERNRHFVKHPELGSIGTQWEKV
jgi:hypothetical protein